MNKPNTPRVFKYTFSVEFRAGGSREMFAHSTTQQDARSCIWQSMDNPERTVRRISLLSKVRATEAHILKDFTR
jgi:hypothetical protein